MCLKKPTLDDLKIYKDILSFWTPQKYDMKDIEDYWSILLEHLSHFYRAATLIAELQQVHQGLQLESLTMDLCQKPRSPKGLIGKIGETRGFYPWVSPPKGCRFPRKPKLKKKTSSQLSVCIWEWREWHLGISLSLSPSPSGSPCPSCVWEEHRP